MRSVRLGSMVVLGAVLAIAPIFTVSAQTAAQSDLIGNWRGDNSHPGGGRWDNTVPEPPLTDWAKQHLLYTSISHDALTGTLADPTKTPYPGISDGQRDFYAKDQNGVPANDSNGEYPGKDCEPLSVPAMFDYPALGSMALVRASEGDRIYQMFEYHREWRVWWLNRDQHPKDLDGTYEGDSIARWDGDTLVVNTTGFNGRSMVMGTVGHKKSTAFRLVERYHLIDHDHMQIDMTYYDPKAWGDKAWTGFHRYYKRVATENVEEFICSPREYTEYNKRLSIPVTSIPGK